MYYALTVNGSIITGVHESVAPITDSTFAANPGMANHTVVPLSEPFEYQAGQDIRTFKEDGTKQTEAWLIKNGYMAIPDNKKIVDGVLVDWHRVFININAKGEITAIQSDVSISDGIGWIQVDEGNGSRYENAANQYLAKPILDGAGVCQYRLAEGAVVERTEEEIAADIAAIPPPPSTMDSVMEELIALLITQGVIIHV